MIATDVKSRETGAAALDARVAALKGKVVAKSYRGVRRGLAKEGGCPYRPQVRLCLERAKLWTESYRTSEGQPYVLRRAKALANVLEKMTVWIQDGELIVGNYASSPHHLNFYPEYSIRWLLKAINDEYTTLLDDAGKADLQELGTYWKEKAVQGLERGYLSPELKKFWNYNGATFFFHGVESGVPDYEMLFRVGLSGLMREAEEQLAAADASTGPASEYVERKDFLRAVIITLKAVIDWAQRYAQLADELSATASDSRKEDLRTIAGVCRSVPANPPRTLHEALQFFYFIHLVTHVIDCHENGIGARMDQVFYPFFAKDLATGTLSRDQAKALFQLLWIKCNELGYLVPPVSGAAIAQGSGIQQQLTLGGVTRDGKDASNELTYLILDAGDELHMLEPTTAIRIHKHTPRKLLARIVQSLRRRSGTVSLFNDEVVIPRLLNLGIPVSDARDYGLEQCMRWTIPGKNFRYRSFDAFILLPKCLELALNRGFDKVKGEQLGLPTADPLSFGSIDDLMEAFVQQVGYCAQQTGKIGGVVDVLYQRYLPRPLLTAMFDGGVASGKSCERWWAYFPRNVYGFLGANDVANSLAAVKKLVFEERRVTMGELLQALADNWEGHDALRAMFQAAPKFGNDDDYVDAIARDVHVRAAKEAEKVRNWAGFPYIVDGSSGSSYYSFSDLCRATPDGRKSADNYGDGTASPAAGTDRLGPSAVLRSVAKLDPLESHNHLLNLKFLPSVLDKNEEAFVALIETWRDLDIHHVQFNVVDSATLIDAQQHPENYQDLVVRVAGYAGIFVDLAKGLQDEIIKRTMAQQF